MGHPTHRNFESTASGMRNDQEKTQRKCVVGKRPPPQGDAPILTILLIFLTSSWLMDYRFCCVK